MENLFFLALVAVLGLVRWFVQAAENKKNAEAAKRAEPSPTAPLQRAPAQTEEERVRRFMEALGVPKGEIPPPRKLPPPPRKRILPVDPFPAPRQQFPPFAPRPASPVTPQVPAPLPLPTPERSMLAEPKRELIHASAPAKAKPPPARMKKLSASTGMAARFANSDGLRDAIVLREILGPPRSMQSLDPARII